MTRKCQPEPRRQQAAERVQTRRKAMDTNEQQSRRGLQQHEGDEVDEDFYDCQEVPAAPPGCLGEGERQPQEGVESTREMVGSPQEGEKAAEEVEETEEEKHLTQTDRKLQQDIDAGLPVTPAGGSTEELPVREEEEQQWEEQEEEDGGLDSDQELKEELKEEFDEEYLMEMEKDLSEEEKASRKQQSLELKEQGNTHFKSGDHSSAEQLYSEALAQCPLCFSSTRAVLFSNRAAARLHLERNDQAIADCSKAIQLNPEYLRALVRRAELYERTEKMEEALEDWKKVLEREPGHGAAREACMRLPLQIHERNERLKEEMMSKLKDLGNMILRPFGLSTTNFQLNEDEKGGYSVNFVQNTHTKNT